MAQSTKNTSSRPPTLSLAMMVRDEERFLEEALLSARDWVDEMVVVDTGSVDRTVEIAKDCGAKVSHYPWPNDFSKARNETIKRSSGDWVAILDADERFRGPHPHRVREMLQPTSAWPYQGILINIVNQRLDGSTTHSFFSPRIFPRHSDIGYYGRVHNCFGSLAHGSKQDFDLVQCLGLEIIHLGYDAQVYAEKNKEARNLTLLEAAVREEPEVDRYRFYLGREYMGIGRLDEALVLLRSVLELPVIDPMCKRETRVAILQCLQTSKASFEVILNEAISILEETPREADAWYLLALTYNKQGLIPETIEALEQALTFVNDVDINMQASRLSGERAKAEVILASHYQDMGPDYQQIAEDWFLRSWSHLSQHDEGWDQTILRILGWTIKTKRSDLLKDILIHMTGLLNETNCIQGFLIGLRELKKLRDHSLAFKILKRAINAQPNLRQDLMFVQMQKELKS